MVRLPEGKPGPETKQARYCAQPPPEQDQSQGGASVSRGQMHIRLPEGTIPRNYQECGAALYALLTRQFIHGEKDITLSTAEVRLKSERWGKWSAKIEAICRIYAHINNFSSQTTLFRVFLVLSSEVP